MDVNWCGKAVSVQSNVFKPGELFTFEGVCRLWGRENVPCTLDFPAADLAKRGEVLNARMGFIQEQLDWLESNRAVLEETLLKENMPALAADWAASAEEAEDPDGECYVMEDGLKVCLPITAEDFCRSLYPAGVSLVFDAGWDQPLISMGLGCVPDYFAGHVIGMTIYADKRVCCDGLVG